MPNLGPTQLLIIAGVFVLLFGAAKLPKLARSLGESARIFKAETKSLHDDAETPDVGSARGDKTPDSATGRLGESNRQEPLDAETVYDDETGRRKAG